MTFDEVIRRILVGHWFLLMLAVCIPVGLTTEWYSRQSPEWAASVRMQTIAQGSTSTTQSAALSARILALATTPSLVRDALDQAGVKGSAETIAANQISAERLGESPVVILTVTAPDRRTSVALVDALARRVAEFVNEADTDTFAKVLTQTESSLAAARQRVARLTAAIVTSRTTERQSALTVQLQGAQTEVDRLQQLSDDLTLQQLGRDRIINVDLGAPEITQVSVGVVPRMALAMILGALIGLFGAVLLETLRPRIPSVRYLARGFNAPVLGGLVQGNVALANALTRAARRAGVETVVVMGVDGRDEKAAHRILAECGGHRAAPAVAAPLEHLAVPTPARAGRIAGNGGDNDMLPRFPTTARLTDLAGVAQHEELSAGVVVVSSGRNREADVTALRDVLDAMRWSVIGVVHAPRGRAGRARKSQDTGKKKG